ncbi:uncharacterized protein BXIN_2249 [Babesia sp. Xinjiang]|uniref:uncharacterized protein n=1 Tax=Babesia sp. Xinjiang TaxID=462227 RepID=UPI000A25C3AF|nr:uncharacterized protein BXIN_2249 [Babesia sp. Xinjiang]ORM40825.1 hypothetical protein BXIN_2249 [Babesia sp. Xinjiang]
MGLDDLSDAQQKLLHPLMRLKRKTSQEAIGSLVEFVGDISRVYHDFAVGLQQLETKAEACSFLTGLSNADSLEALRVIRDDVTANDDSVVAVTKEQQGMTAIWMSLFTMLSRTRKETTDFISTLGHSIADPLSAFCDEFNDGFYEPVDQLEMNDVLNFIPNLKTLKQMPGFHHCGARKYVENVLKAYKDLQNALENEKELVGDAAGINRGKSQAKAVNKTVKAKISLGKHIQHLFDQAPEMKILITKGVSHDTIEQLANSKLKKSPVLTEKAPTDPLDFHTRFCAMEKRRLSMFSSFFQILVESLVNYERNSYQNLRDLYQAVVAFSPESDYVHFESLILGAQLCHIATHYRMPEDIWIPRNLAQLEPFTNVNQDSPCLAVKQAKGIEDGDSETATVIGDEAITVEDLAELDRNVIETTKELTIEKVGSARSITAVIRRISSAVSEMLSGASTPSIAENASVSSHGNFDDVEQLSARTDESNDNSALTCTKTGLEITNDMRDLGSVDAQIKLSVSDMQCSVLKPPVYSPTTDEFPSVADAVLRKDAETTNAVGGGARLRASSISKLIEKDSDNKHVSLLRRGMFTFSRHSRPAIRRSSSALPCDIRNLSIPLFTNKNGKKNDRMFDNKHNKKETSNNGQAARDRKRATKGDKTPIAYILHDVKCDSTHFADNPDKPFNDTITFDFETFKTAKEILQKTLERSDRFFIGLHRHCGLDINQPFDFLVDDLNKFYDAGDHSEYPFEMLTSQCAAATCNKTSDTLDNADMGMRRSSPEVPSGETRSNDFNCNLRRVLRLAYDFDDGCMDMRQWNLLSLESLVLLHKYLSNFLTHPCLSNNSDNTLKEFLLTNLGIMENIVARIRNFIDILRKRIDVTKQEYAVLDVLLTPRDSFVNESPHIRIHPMDVRYRMLLLIDSLRKNDVPLADEFLFDLPEFKQFLNRQISLIKLSMMQKLARVIRRIPTLDSALTSRWTDALKSEDPMKVLTMKFTFESDAKVELIANKILFLLCECIGRLNGLQRVVEKGQWGEESVCDSNYMTIQDQLLHLLNTTTQLEDLDNDLMGLLGVEPKQLESTEALNKTKSNSSVVYPFKTPQEGTGFRNPFNSRLTGRKASFTQNDKSASRNVTNIPISDADAHFCTPMSIFDDEDISVLKRVNGRRGCFNKCMSRRNRRHLDTQHSFVNPYFIEPLEETKLSRCWKLEDSVIMRLAACYHNLLAEPLRLGEWSMNFTTIEYVVYFLSTGCLLNFLLYRERKNTDYTKVCTLFHALLSVDALSKIHRDVNKTAFGDGLITASHIVGGSPVDNLDDTKDRFAILQVPHNIAALPKVLGDIELYLQMDMREAVSSLRTLNVARTAPNYSSIQFSDWLTTENLKERVYMAKKDLAGVQLNRSSYKIHRLILDSICHNIPIMSRIVGQDSLSLINGSPCEQWVTNILMLRILTQNFAKLVFQQLVDFNVGEGETSLALKLSCFILVNRLLYQDDLYRGVSDAGPLDSRSLLEISENDLNINNLLRRVIMEQARSTVANIFAKLEAFKVEDFDSFAASVIDNLTTSIKENLQFSSTWDDYLPMGDFGVLFTNACIYFFKITIRNKLSRPLDVCKVMPSAHKLRLLQREIETSRLVKIHSGTQYEDLLQVLKFSFAHQGLPGRELLSEHSDIMAVIGLDELEKRLGTLKDVVTRGMKNEDWTQLGSQNHTRAVVDMATVFNATVNATLSLNIPLSNLLLPLTGALEGALNHYFSSVAGSKASEYVEQIMSKLGHDTLISVEDILSRMGGCHNIEYFFLRMGNMIYLGKYLIECQDNIVQYYHRMLTERCEDSEEVHRQLETDIYRDSSKFFTFGIESFQSMKELALVPASKRLIQRQCEWHITTLARLCTLATLLPPMSRLYQPTVARGSRVTDILGKIKDMCSEFSKLGEYGTTALYVVFESTFHSLMCVIRTSRHLSEESGLLLEDIETLASAAMEHQQDMSSLVALAKKLIK